LTPEEHAEFRSRRRHFWIAAGIFMMFALAIALLHGILKFQVWPALVLPLGFSTGIYLLFRMLAFRCPRCATIPMVPRVSFTTTEVQAGSFVALNPKMCQTCGVHFELGRGA